MSVSEKPPILNRAAEQAADALADTAPGAPPKTALRTHMVQSLVQQGGKILCVRRGSAVGTFWEMPGALTRTTGDAEEDFEACQARGLMECVGLETSERVCIYQGPNTIVYAVGAREPAVRKRVVLTAGWLSPDELRANTERPKLVDVILSALERAEVIQSNVISKLKDGRILYAIQYETSLDGITWEPHEAHCVHALNAEDARAQFNELRAAAPRLRVQIVGVAPAIGFHRSATDENVLLG